MNFRTNSEKTNTFIICGFILTLAWFFMILGSEYMDPINLKEVLEFIFSRDGKMVIEPSSDGKSSFTSKVIFKIGITPVLLIFTLWLGFKILDICPTSSKILYGYFLYFSVSLVSFWSYTKFALNGFPVEGGLLETITFFLALGAAILFAICGFLNVRISLIISLLFIFFAFEEISWGQEYFNFRSPELFQKYNYQSEINIHNFFNPILPFLYAPFNLFVVFCLTAFPYVRLFSYFYKTPSAKFLIGVSNKYALWLFPLFLSFTSIYPGMEFVEEQFSIFGFIFSFLLLLEIFKNRATKALD